MWDCFLDALVDTLNILPVLFLVYTITNMISHSENFGKIILKSKKFGPLFASALGIFPQCGFSSAMADMFSKRYITVGSLFAVFIATSDEAFAVLIAYPNFVLNLLLLLAIKFVFAVIVGYAIDLCTKKLFSYASVNQMPESHHCHCNILVESFFESIKIGLYILIATFVINFILSIFSLESISNFVGNNIFLQPVITALVGIIPNCASSVLLVTMYVNGIIHFGSLVGGLSAGSGVGILVLFKNNKNIKQNIIITISMILIGIASGIIINLIELLF